MRADGPVTVVSADHSGVSACTVTFQAIDGSVAQVLVPDDAANLALAQDDVGVDADDGELFRLAAEASRIKDAAQFDPMLAVSTSMVERLPHQIRAGHRRPRAAGARPQYVRFRPAGPRGIPMVQHAGHQASALHELLDHAVASPLSDRSQMTARASDRWFGRVRSIRDHR
ncbi:hypothetical protein ACWCOV_10080 [Kribbella sp. NPDC002412]